MIDIEFYKKVNKLQDPLIGTEIMAPLLYYFIRSIRPQNVLEYGMGYSTLYILKALSDNLKSFEHEKKSLLKKQAHFSSPISEEDFDTYFFDKDTPYYNPTYYQQSYKPQLICFEKLPHSHPYTKSIMKVVDSLNLNNLLTVIEGDASRQSEKIPSHFLPLDFIWNDDDYYYDFFKTYCNLLNNNDAYILYHNTEEATSVLKNDMEKIKKILQNEPNYEIINIVEPHKLNQRSFTMIRKKGNKTETHYDIPSHQKRIYENFLKFKESQLCLDKVE